VVAGPFDRINGMPMSEVARLNADGSLDTRFTEAASVNRPVYALALQSDGRILIGGDFNVVNGQPRVRVARLNADGSLDSTFDPGTGPDGTVRQIAVQPSGTGILIRGDFTSVAGQSRPGLARLIAGPGALQFWWPTAISGGLRVVVSTELGVVYQVEATSDFASGWTTESSFTGKGAVETLDLPVGAKDRFYRLRR
jgi:uncharacterized delta-60 repeat protein